MTITFFRLISYYSSWLSRKVSNTETANGIGIINYVLQFEHARQFTEIFSYFYMISYIWARGDVITTQQS